MIFGLCFYLRHVRGIRTKSQLLNPEDPGHNSFNVLQTRTKNPCVFADNHNIPFMIFKLL